jgi:hypothetical protein
VTAAIPLFGAFLAGLGTRRWLQQHVTLLFRLQLAGGIGLLSVLAGWSFDISVRNVAAIGVLLVAQLASVGIAARVFRTRTDGALFSFWMFGNPTFWTAPVAAAALGAEAAVFVIAYDMLTQARIAVGVRHMRANAPKSQSARTALADYAPTICAMSGLALGIVLPAPDFVDSVVAGLGIAMALAGFLLLGVSWPRNRWTGAPQVAMTLRALALHYTIVPAILGLAVLAGVDLPGAVWLLAFGPVPTSVVSFSQVYGFSPRTAATGLAMSIACAIAFLPLSLTLAG